MKLVKKDLILSIIKVIMNIAIFVVILVLVVNDVIIFGISISRIGALLGVIAGSMFYHNMEDLINSIKNFIYDKKDKTLLKIIELERRKEDPKSLAEELSTIADTSGFENLEQEVDNMYNEILREIKILASQGLHIYQSKYHKNSYLAFLSYTNSNVAKANRVISKFKEDKLIGYWESIGNSYIEITIKW